MTKATIIIITAATACATVNKRFTHAHAHLFFHALQCFREPILLKYRYNMYNRSVR